MVALKMANLQLDADLPNNVSTQEQLSNLPPECVSSQAHANKPLRHVDEKGNVYHYALQPMFYSVVFILAVETIERFSFYGVYYTQTFYLTGVYNEDWNAGFDSVTASTFVSVATAVAYTTPFVGALLADSVLGDYKAIVFGTTCLYLPGLILVALTTVPGLLGDEFNTTALSFAVLLLWPMGTGVVKSVVNVFGARQFHPILQSRFISSYYVHFYSCINVGSLVGITLLPIIAQTHVTIAYLIPVVMLSLCVLVFLTGTPRYVREKPRGELCSAKKKSSSGNNTIPLSTMFRISVLIVPFCIAYSQMPTTFIVQGTVMRRAFGVIDAATMNSLDALSVLFFGYLTGSHLYPALAKRGIKLPTTYKFAIGSFLGCCSILWALYVEKRIHNAFYDDNGSQISVLWQAPSYLFIGFGEIFAVSAAYEVAFTASSPQQKVLASATNIFCVGGIPNVLCIILYQACQGWFRNSRGNTNISHLADYATAHIYKYFLVLVGILLGGVLLNTLPGVRDFVDSIECQAAELVKTPLLKRRLDEGTPLLRKKMFGDRPVLYHTASMREGQSLSNIQAKSPKPFKSSWISRIYKSTSGDRLTTLTKKAPPPSEENDADDYNGRGESRYYDRHGSA